MKSAICIAIFIIILIILFEMGIICNYHQMEKKEIKKLMDEFDDFVIKNNLTIDKKQRFNKSIIGLDRLNFNLVFYDYNGHRFQLISLKDLAGCCLIIPKCCSDFPTAKMFLQCSFKQNHLADIILPLCNTSNDPKMLCLFKKAANLEKSINLLRETAILTAEKNR